MLRRKGKNVSTQYAIKLVRLDPKTGQTLHELAAGTDDLTLFNKTDLQPFLDQFAKNDHKYNNPFERPPKTL